MFVSARFCGAAVFAPALSTIKCCRPAALVASSGNQGGWFQTFAGAMGHHICAHWTRHVAFACMWHDLVLAVHAHDTIAHNYYLPLPCLKCMRACKFHVHVHDEVCVHQPRGVSPILCSDGPIYNSARP